MASLKRTIARKAVKSTAKHTAHGTVSKLRRGPFRAAALLAVGGLLSGFAVAAWGSRQA
jgi:hypothetical protein